MSLDLDAYERFRNTYLKIFLHFSFCVRVCVGLRACVYVSVCVCVSCS